MNADEILKIRYTVWTYYQDDDGIWEYYKCVYKLTPDGKLVSMMYTSGNRKAYNRQVFQLSPQDYLLLCEKINDCENHADRLGEVEGDYIFEVKLYRPFDRIDKLNGRTGTSTATLDDLISEYLKPFFDECNK